MIQLKFSVDGADTLSRRLVGVQTKLKNFTKPLARSGEIILKDIRINFDTEGGLVGGWQPLKTATIRDRVRKGYGAGPILHRTGKYKRSFKGEVKPKKLTIDAWNVDYHKYHQSSAPRTKLPRRKTVFLRAPIRNEIHKIFQEYVRFNI